MVDQLVPEACKAFCHTAFLHASSAAYPAYAT